MKLNPESQESLINKILVLNTMGQFSEGLKASENALIIESKDKNAWKNKADSLIGLERYDEALKAIEEALKLDPNFLVAQNTKNKCLAFQNTMQQNIPTENLDIPKGIKYEAKPLLKSSDLKDDGIVKSLYKGHELRLIGVGGFGKVIFAKNEANGERLAVKILEMDLLKDFNTAIAELVNLENIKNHKHIMTYKEYKINIVTVNENSKIHQILIEMKLADNSLENILKERKSLAEKVIIIFFRQLCEGLKFAHDKKIAHMDLKPENILIISEDCLIADWGSSIQMSSNTSTRARNEISNTRAYSAPEVSESYGDQAKYNFYFSDIYTLGLVVLRMCGFSPLELDNIPRVKQKYHDDYLEDDIYSKLKAKSYSDKFIDLVRRLPVFDPKDRISLQDTIDALNTQF